MPVTLLFLHGWGFDASFWEPLRARLDGLPGVADERGYFGAPPVASPDGPCIAIAHSFGAMRLLRDPPPGCRGLIAINGFARFAARGQQPGVAPRVIDRMLARLAGDPARVLADFRARCGTSAPFGTPDSARLHTDLAALRDEDHAAACAAVPFPILSLQGAADPVLPPALREAAFAGATRLTCATHPASGHLLPQAESDYCARAIRACVEQWA